ncbi:SIR2 family NAD-dependent protein deacylase [Oceanospirillum beijerinckii]|uniref:SIR2 family NAD-dependent protein deacylase n=1 Tax=Oceanospirillum beijerinckii TaxID=64976 RepID=UPI0003FE90AA|nr:Sir2 family NAD-dependent protein deacetylase [Oceanospirillum beijerinckii]
MDKNYLERAAREIDRAGAILIAAGAGMGVDSGLPDFRGDKGFWKAYPQLKDEGVSFMDLANPEWFLSDPERAWGFYGHRFMLYQSAKPHEGFQILQKWGSRKLVKPFVFTSNVDGHFQKAGFDPGSVYECHGSINYLQCANNCSRAIWSFPKLTFEIGADLRAKGKLPTCPKCGFVARPNILMFGDWSWNKVRSDQQEIAFRAWKRQAMNHRLVAIEIGAGKNIPTVRMSAESMNCTLIRINLRDADKGRRVIPISGKALDVLERLEQLFI